MHASENVVGWAVAVNSAGSFLASPLFGWWADRRSTREVLAVSLCVMVGGNIMYSLATNIWILLVGRFIVGVASGIHVLLIDVLLIDVLLITILLISLLSFLSLSLLSF